ncbi:MAG: ABC transporter ATP-binding protein [Phycisphaerales bacterium]|nr:ABC transporter ATP-binding protein [Phycisphaerales bacterium]
MNDHMPARDAATDTRDIEHNRGVAVTARDLKRHYEDGRIRAVDGVTLDIRPGNFVAICGPSGCGKSTLLNLLAGIDRAESGSLRVADRELAELDETELDEYRRSTVGLIFQLHNLLPELSALENVQTPMLMTALSGRERVTRATELLERVGLGHRLHATPNRLSGGERQRVAIARALANRPRLLMADEPTGSLDSQTGAQALDLLEALRRDQGVTLIMVTHDPNVAARADRVLNMLDGRFVD